MKLILCELLWPMNIHLILQVLISLNLTMSQFAVKFYATRFEVDTV